MSQSAYDLWFDLNAVGADLVAECSVSHGPRADDPFFDPAVGDWLRVGDEDATPLRARVIRRDGDRVRVQIRLPSAADPVA